MRALARRTGKPQTKVKHFLEAFTEKVTEVLKKGNKLTDFLFLN
jgi:nucleoid DNA-binding protein